MRVRASFQFVMLACVAVQLCIHRELPDPHGVAMCPGPSQDAAEQSSVQRSAVEA